MWADSFILHPRLLLESVIKGVGCPSVSEAGAGRDEIDAERQGWGTAGRFLVQAGEEHTQVEPGRLLCKPVIPLLLSGEILFPTFTPSP